MQNIDPVYFLQPILTILFSIGLVIYWHRYKRRLTKSVLLYSLIAYGGAIAVKVVFQAVTYTGFKAAVGGNPYALGAYFASQTMILEVGGAFLAASWLSSRRRLNAEDAEGYGLSLAMWENAGFLGIIGMVNLITIYVLIAAGGSAAESLSPLLTNRPELFYPLSQALPLVAYSLLERVTSLLIHFSFGILTVLSACLHKRQLLLAAFPMGFIDFFVPFATNVDIALFEMSLFLLAIGSLGLTVYITKRARSHGK